MRRVLLTNAIVALLASVAAASTWSVQRDGSGDFTTIQPALDAAADGDTILIGPGEYTEATTVRLPGWAYDIESYAHLRCDDLTIIGAGADVTVIGPPTYQGNAATGSPAGLSYSVNGGTLNISDVTIRHSYAMFVLGILYVDRCRFENNKIGISWNPSGPGGWVRDSVVEVTDPIFDPMAFAIGVGGLGSGVLLENCQFHKPGSLRTVHGIELRSCDLVGMNVYASTDVVIRNCAIAGGEVAVSQSQGGSTCAIYDSDLSGSVAALTVLSDASGGRFVVENSRLSGGSYGVLWLRRFSGPCEVYGCDLIRGTGPVVQCDPSGPVVTHSMTGNYWGTTDEPTIQSWIIDHADNPQIGATVIYSPYAGQSVPTESTSWGELKALWR